MKKVFVSVILILLLSMFLYSTAYAGVPIPSGVVDGMKEANNGGSGGTSSQTAEVLNNIIGLIQIAGSGIALVVITMMGIKYMLAAPSEKADVKKMVMPIIIGCILLFGAVNLAGFIEDFTGDTLK